MDAADRRTESRKKKQYPYFLNSMNDSLLKLNVLIKKEADELLFEKGLFSILRSSGTPHISGSYVLDLMTWRDLDIYLEVDNIPETDFFVLGGKICSVFQPVKMSFRNELIAKTKGLPAGLYWGIYLANERAGAWKIDIWAVNNLECQRLVNYCADIKQKLTPATVVQILDIKSQCWKDPEYRRSYTSTDIYDAVLEKKVSDIEDFKNYLKTFKVTG
ncbi:MAG: hypothetical protein ICV81_15035 [Flavisolibacter sp.]|nr:hypothetical protein [Flavisolibacter sp.]